MGVAVRQSNLSKTLGSKAQAVSPAAFEEPVESWQGRLTAHMLRFVTSDLQKIRASQDPARWRDRFNKLALKVARLPDTATTSLVAHGEWKARWIELPGSRPHCVVLYLHGGGYVFGSPATHQAMVARLCEAAQARALMLDYRLAPEHPYPAALEDALNAYRWLLANGLKPEEIVVAGDSAGGGLAASLLQALRDNEDRLPAGALLISPWTDLAMTGWSIHANGERDPFVTIPMLSYCANLYLKGISPTDPLASPFYGDCQGLPPIMVQASKRELLFDDGQRFAAKAEAAGIDVTFDAFESALHVLPFFPRVPEARDAIDRAAGFIKAMTQDENIWREDEMVAEPVRTPVASPSKEVPSVHDVVLRPIKQRA